MELKDQPPRKNNLNRHGRALVGQGELLAHGVDCLPVCLDRPRLLQYGAAGDHHVHARLGDLPDVVDLDAAVDLQAAVQAVVVDELARLPRLVEGRGNEGLPAESRIDAHEQDDVELVLDKVGVFQRGGGVEHESRLAPAVLDELEAAIDVVGRLGVEGDVGCAGVYEVVDGGVNGGHHEVHVDGGRDAVVAQGLADHGADGQVGNVVVVHDIEVDDVGAGLEHVVDLLAETGEVGGEDGGGDEVVLVAPDIEFGRRAAGRGRGRGAERAGGGEGGGECEGGELHGG